MVSQHIIDIIIKAEDQASQAAKKVEDAMNRVSNTSKRSMDSASNSMNKFDSSVQKAAPTLDNFTQRLQAAGTGGGRAFQQLSQAEIQMVTNLNSAQAKMGEFGNQITSTASKTSMLGSTGTSAFNQLTFAEQRALVQLSSMSATTNSTATQMNSAWDRVKTKVSSVSTSIKTGLSNALSSARSKIDSIASAFDGLGGIISSAIGGLGVASFSQLTIGLAMTRERMTSLTTATMGSASAAQDFVNTMDSMTNDSLVSLNDLGQAMNTIKMSTGMSNSELKNFSTTVNDIGQRAILMGKDTNEAMTMMQAAGSGLNGEFDVLKSNFGITKEKLMDLGWSGASEDVAGYQEAIEKYLEKAGSMDEMMDTTTGKLKQVEKGFTSAGRQIGEQFMPYIDQGLDFMIALKDDCPQAYTAIVALSGAFSGFATIAPTLAPILQTIDSLSSKASKLKNVLSGSWNDGKLNSLKQKFDSLKTSIGNLPSKISDLKSRISGSWNEGSLSKLRQTFINVGSSAKSAATQVASLGKKALVAGGQAVISAGKWAIETAAKYASAAAQTLLNAVMSMNPITIVVIAIVALVAVLIYLYQNCEPVRNAINQLWEILKGIGEWIYSGLIGAWNALVSALQPVRDIFESVFMPLFNAFSALLEGNLNGALANFVAFWRHLVTALGPVGDIMGEYLTPIFMMFVGILMNVWNAVSQIIGVFQQFITGQITLPQMLSQIWTIITQLFSTVFNLIIQGILNFARNIWNNAVTAGRNLLNGVIQYVQQLPGKVWNWITQTASKITSGATQWVNNAKSKAKGVVDGVINWVKQLPGKVYQEFMNIGSRILSAGSDLVNKAKQVGQNIVNGILGAMGIHSPGTIQESIALEFKNMIGRISGNVGDAYKAAKLVGADIVSGFQSQNVEDALNVMPNINTESQEEGFTPNVAAVPTTVTTEVNTETNDAASSGLSQMVQATNTAYTAMQNKETFSMNAMLAHVTSSMNLILTRTRMSLASTTAVTQSNLQNMSSSTASITSEMVDAWETMKNKIVRAASDIKSDSTRHFDKLSSTIGSFYRKLQNPSSWGAGPAGSRGPRGAGRPASKMSNITSKMAEKIKAPHFVSVQEVRQNPCFNSSCLEYLSPTQNGSNIKTTDLIRGGCVDCVLGLENMGNAGWADSVAPNVNHIKQKSRNWSMRGPVIAGKYQTGLSFRVSDFETGTPKIDFQSFKSMAESLFSQIPYAFYYDSEKYGTWQNAIMNGECNCSDGSDALIALAHTCGLSASKVHGHWGSVGHFWATVEGHKMDTTGWQKQRNWTPAQSHAGPSPTDPFDKQNGILERIATDLQTGEEFDIYSGETVDSELTLNGEITVKHEFINLPDGMDEKEVARLISEATNDSDWLKSLIQNSKFQDLDKKVKRRLALKANRAKGV